MRLHKILTRTLLILSIINFALTAPVAVRGRPEVRFDANVSGKVTAAPQKRQDSLDKRGSSTNVPGPDNAPLPSSLTEHMAYPASLPPAPDSLGSGSRLPVGSMPVAGSLSPPPPPSPYLSQRGSSEDRFPSPSGVSVNPDTLWATGPTGYQSTPPQGPEVDPEIHSLLNPDIFSSKYWDNVLEALRLPVGSMPVASFLSPPPPPPPHPSQLGPPEGHFLSPSGVSMNPDTLSATGPAGYQPTPPQGPEVDPEIHSLLNPELFPTEFWDNVLKGKFKRGISRSG